MPLQIDEEAIAKATIVDLNKPPTKHLAHTEFPKCIYRHPKEKFRKERVKDELGVIGEVTVPNTHVSKVVQNKAELEKALKEGWVKDPYLPAELPKEEF